MTAFQGFSRRQVLSWSAAAVGAATLPVQAQTPTKIVFGFTAVNDFASVFVAKEEGYFSKRGLDVEPKFIPLNPSIPSLLQRPPFSGFLLKSLALTTTSAVPISDSPLSFLNPTKTDR